MVMTYTDKEYIRVLEEASDLLTKKSEELLEENKRLKRELKDLRSTFDQRIKLAVSLALKDKSGKKNRRKR